MVGLCGCEGLVAERYRLRLLGFAWARRRRCPPGLLFRGCRSVHGVGMLFSIELVFLDEDDRPIERRTLRPFGFASNRGAAAVLELRP